jgi:uncharacterized membrane protein YbhN (UPF0104 family)
MNELAVAAWSMTETAGGHLAGVSVPLLLAGVALHTLKLGARARAWQNILRASLPGRPIRYRDAAAPYLGGLGASAVLPFGGGEVLRIGLARARLGRPDEHESMTATIVGSVAVERVLDVVVSGIVIAVALTAGLLPNGALHGKTAGLAALAAHPVSAAVVGAGLCLAAAAVARRLRHRMNGVRSGFRRGFRVLRRPARYLASVASWQLLSWLLRVAALVLFLEAFHVPAAVAVAPFVLSLQLVAGSVPVTPGGAGTQQALAAALGSGALVGFSAGAQATTMFVDVLLGIAALASCGIRPRFALIRAAATAA